MMSLFHFERIFKYKEAILRPKHWVDFYFFRMHFNKKKKKTRTKSTHLVRLELILHVFLAQNRPGFDRFSFDLKKSDALVGRV
jgi:hypothetical protein